MDQVVREYRTSPVLRTIFKTFGGQGEVEEFKVKCLSGTPVHQLFNTTCTYYARTAPATTSTTTRATVTAQQQLWNNEQAYGVRRSDQYVERFDIQQGGIQSHQVERAH